MKLFPDRTKIQELGDGCFHPISHNNNMMVVRYILSTYIIIMHAGVLAGIDIPGMGYARMAVGGFFALSGFLLFASFQKRPSLRHYISRRGRRILPPYIFIVVLCWLCLWTVSSLDISGYFLNGQTWGYLAANLSFMNFLQPSLPGVFDDPRFLSNAVNGSLWTMKGEWACYLSIPLVFKWVTSMPRHRGGIVLMALIAASIIIDFILTEITPVSAHPLAPIIAKQFSGLVVFFYTGALINLYLPLFMKYKWVIFWISLLSVILLIDTAICHYVILPLAVSSLTIFISLVGNWGAKISRHDNVSYDMYLFHFPLIQLFIYFGLSTYLPGYMFVIISILASYLLGMASWNLIGKKFMAK